MVLVIAPEVRKKLKSRESFVRDTKNRARRKEAVLDNKTAGTPELQKICGTLHMLAQKYVPNNPQSFSDFTALKHATASLSRLGVCVEIAAHLCAPIKSLDRSVVFNSAEYRILRNKYIAALATIADLPDKNSPPGSEDFQRGVREGYRRASEVAIAFLEDIQIGAV